MKKNLLYAFALICSLSFFTACSDDEENANWTKLPTETISAENLTLTTNSQSFPNASVSLAMTDAQNGVLTLNNAVRGLNKVAVNVSVAEQSDGSFSFQGTNSIATTKAVADLVSSIDVNVAGTITLDGKATVEVTSAANGFLVKKWVLADSVYRKYNEAKLEMRCAPASINWKSTYNNGTSADNIDNIGTLALSVVMNKLLNTVEFCPNGAIVANYVKEVPEIDFNTMMSEVMGAMFSGTLASRADLSWVTSPENLAYWYASGDNLYVALDIANIVSQAMKDQGQEGESIDFAAILEMLKGMSGAEIKNLLSGLLQGLGEDNAILAKLDLNKISDSDIEKFVGYLFNGFPLNYQLKTVALKDGSQLEDIYINIDKETFDIVMPVLFPLLPDLEEIVKNIKEPVDVWAVIQGLLGINSLTEIENIWNETSSFNIGLDLANGSFKVVENSAE